MMVDTGAIRSSEFRSEQMLWQPNPHANLDKGRAEAKSLTEKTGLQRI